MKYIFYDLKRVFESRALVIICIISPIIIMILFGSIVAPLLFTAKITKFNVAIINEDKSKEVAAFLNQMLNSKALEDLVVPYSVNSLDEGIELLESNDVLIVIHIPNNLLDSIKSKKKTYVDLYSQNGHNLEITLIKMTLNSSLSTVEKGQNLIEYSTKFFLNKGISLEELESFVTHTTNLAINEFMNRRAILSQEGTISPVGEYVPTEYYMGAIFTFFAVFAMIPLAAITSRDLKKNVLQRGFLWNKRWIAYFFARIFSGFIFISMIIVLVYPSSILSSLLNATLKMDFSTNMPALFFATILSALCYSSMALLIGSVFYKGDISTWVAFYIAIFMAVISGAIIPAVFMPDWVNLSGGLLPFRASMRSITNALFLYDRNQYLIDIYKLIAWNIIFFAGAFFSMRKRGFAK
jgi:ABC-2 type transport system permease protein